MPSGKTHDNIAFVSIIPVFLLSSYLLKFNLAESCIFTLAATFSQFMFGPDLDAQSHQYKRWGILKWIWIPYRKIFAHRSRFSHGIIFGPIIRCVYFIATLIVAFIMVKILLNIAFGLNIFDCLFSELRYLISDLKNSYYINFLTPFLFSLIAGIFLGAAIHTFTDKFFSFFKNII